MKKNVSSFLSLPRARPHAMDNWTKIQANITKGVKEITDLFTSTGPDLPETDMEMCLEADRAYAEGARRKCRQIPRAASLFSDGCLVARDLAPTRAPNVTLTPASRPPPPQSPRRRAR